MPGYFKPFMHNCEIRYYNVYLMYMYRNTIFIAIPLILCHVFMCISMLA